MARVSDRCRHSRDPGLRRLQLTLICSQHFDAGKTSKVQHSSTTGQPAAGRRSLMRDTVLGVCVLAYDDSQNENVIVLSADQSLMSLLSVPSVNSLADQHGILTNQTSLRLQPDVFQSRSPVKHFHLVTASVLVFSLANLNKIVVFEPGRVPKRYDGCSCSCCCYPFSKNA